MISHLTYVLKHISPDHRTKLLRTTPQQIRQSVIADTDLTALHIVDRHSQTPVVDLDIGNAIALPKLSEVVGDELLYLRNVGDFSLYKAVKRGSLKVRTGIGQISLRIGPERYVGLAKFRHLEDPDE